MYDLFTESHMTDMDAAQYHIENAMAYVEMLADPSLMIFSEASTPAEAEQKATIGFIESIKKAVANIIEMIKDAISNITTFVQFQFLSKDDKEKYRKFREVVKSDPELKNTKVTIVAWKEYEAVYEAALKKAEARKHIINTEMANTIYEEMKSNVQALMGTGTKAGTRAATSVTLDMAMDIADQSSYAAKALKYALDKELVSMEAIANTLGDKRADKFKSHVDTAAKATIWHRLKVKILKHKTNTVNKVGKKYMKKIMSFSNFKNGKLPKGKAPVSAGSIARGMLMNPTLTRDVIGADTVGDGLSAGIKGAYNAKRFEYDAKRAVRKTMKGVKRNKAFWLG